MFSCQLSLFEICCGTYCNPGLLQIVEGLSACRLKNPRFFLPQNQTLSPSSCNRGCTKISFDLGQGSEGITLCFHIQTASTNVRHASTKSMCKPAGKTRGETEKQLRLLCGNVFMFVQGQHGNALFSICIGMATGMLYYLC